MIFNETKLKGAFIIEPKKLKDKRGFFARAWDSEQIKEYGLNPKIIQSNISFNKKKGTLHGMHYQTVPYQEVKLIRCTQGRIFDVIIDLRNKSKTKHDWFGIELTAKNSKMLYMPKGFAHGYQALEDNTEVFYQISQAYKPKYERGIRWDDPLINIKWPMNKKIISDKDKSWKFLQSG